jgi:hypothetical protein
MAYMADCDEKDSDDDDESDEVGQGLPGHSSPDQQPSARDEERERSVHELLCAAEQQQEAAAVSPLTQCAMRMRYVSWLSARRFWRATVNPCMCVCVCVCVCMWMKE